MKSDDRTSIWIQFLFTCFTIYLEPLIFPALFHLFSPPVTEFFLSVFCSGKKSSGYDWSFSTGMPSWFYQTKQYIYPGLYLEIFTQYVLCSRAWSLLLRLQVMWCLRIPWRSLSCIFILSICRFLCCSSVPYFAASAACVLTTFFLPAHVQQYEPPLLQHATSML